MNRWNDGSSLSSEKIYSWTKSTNKIVYKVADKTLIKYFSTGIPKQLARTFFKINLNVGEKTCINLKIKDKIFNAVINCKLDERHVLSLSSVKNELNLKDFVLDRDTLWFEKDDNLDSLYICSAYFNGQLTQCTKPTTKQIQVESRIGQQIFKRNVSIICNNSCVVTGVKDISPSILIGSHIKPWTDSSDDERLDGYNGLLLAPHIDKLFDSFLITFNSNKQLVVSEVLPKECFSEWNIDATKKYNFHDNHMKYMSYHNQEFDRLETERVAHSQSEIMVAF